MPRLLQEQEAFHLAGNLDSLRGQLSPEEVSTAEEALRLYKSTQESRALPLFPKMERAQQEQEQKFRSIFTVGVDSVVDYAPELGRTLKSSANPGADKVMAANVAFLSKRTGLSNEEVASKYGDLINQYSSSVWGKPITDEQGFFSRAQQEVVEQVGAEERRNQAMLDAVRDAGTDGTFMDKYTAWQMGQTEKGPNGLEYANVYRFAANKLAPHKALVKGLVAALKPEGNDPEQVQAFADELVQLPTQDRALVISAVMAEAEKTGSAANKDWTFWKQTGDSFSRTLLGAGVGMSNADAELALEMFRKNVGTGEMEVPKDVGVIDTPEKARKVFQSNMDFAVGTMMSKYTPGVATAPMVKAEGERRSVSADEMKLLLDQAALQERKINVARQITQAASSADPIKNVFSSAIGSSLAAMPFAAAGAGGIAMLAQGYAGLEYEQLRLEHPDMDPAYARQVSAVSGAIQAAIDRFQFAFLKGKLPSFSRFIQEGVMSQTLKRSGIRLLEGTVFQNVQEALQDITTPVVQEVLGRLNADMPGVDWEKEGSLWAAGRADVAIGMLPLVLIGVGMGGVNDLASIARQTDINSVLGQMGVSAQDRKGVLDALASNKPQDALNTLREAMARRDPAVAKQFASEPSEVSKIFDQLEQGAGGNVSFRRDGQGWTVTMPDGTSTTAPSFEEAKAVAQHSAADAISRDIEEAAQLADFFVNQDRTNVNESVTFENKAQTMRDDVAAGVLTEEQAVQRSVLAGQMLGLTREESLAQTLGVLGRNITDTQTAVADSASKLFRGRNVLTVIEEVVEGRLKAGLASRLYNNEQVRLWVKLAEDATGQKFLFNDTEAGLTEAVSAIIVADTLGNRKQGKLGEVGFDGKAGAVTRGVINSISSVAESGKFSAFLHAFRAFFKQVFQRARAISKAKAEGKLGQDYQGFVDSLLGVSEDTRQMNAAATEAEQMVAGEAAAREEAQAQDAEYLAALERGDMEAAQRMVGEAARAAGYNSGMAFHGTSNQKFTSFDPAKANNQLLGNGFYFIDSEIESRYYGPNTIRAYLKLGNAAEVDTTKEGETLPDFSGFDSTVAKTHMGKVFRVATPNQIKSADPVTYDESGNVIPLSQRFNPADNRITYALAPQKFSEALQTELAQRLNKEPDTRRQFYREALKRLAKLEDTLDMDEMMTNDAVASKLRKQAMTRRDALYYDLRQGYAGVISTKDDLFIRKKAKAESDRWLRDALDKIPTDKERILGLLKTYNAVLMGLPPSERGKIGGFVAVASAPTTAKGLEVLRKKVVKVGEVVEKMLREEYRDAIKGLFNKGVPSRQSGKGPRSNVDADTATAFELANEASKWDEAKILAEVSTREGIIADPDTTPEMVDRLRSEIETIELVGNIKLADAARLAAIHDTLDAWLTTGLLVRNQYVLQQREKIKQAAEDFIAATGISNVQAAQADQEARKGSTSNFLRNITLDLSDNNQLIRYLVGDADIGKMLMDMDRKSDFDLEDLNDQLDKSVDDFFTMLAGDEYQGHVVQYQMATQRNVKAKDGTKLTQMQAAHAVMTWRQEDGKRHMQGTFDELGNQTSTWAYDQDWVDSVESQLQVETKALMAWLGERYREGHAVYDPLYRVREGVSLPFNAKYSPLSTEPGKAKAFEIIDPVSGLSITDVGLKPSSLRTRSSTAVARPVFNDALQLYIARTKQMNLWVARYDFVKMVQGIFLSRKTLEYVRGVAGDEGVRLIKARVQQFTQGGYRDAATGMEIKSWLTNVINRAASTAILGRISTLTVQTTALAAAEARMPTSAFMRMQSKLFTGQLNWMKTFDSRFIQRRVAQKSPLIRQIMASLARTTKPNRIKVLQKHLASALAKIDGFATAATYTMIYHYKLEVAGSMGMNGVAAEEWAANEAERETEEISQPVRQSMRSIPELEANVSWLKAFYAFSSEARQKLALMMFAVNRKIRGEEGYTQLARTAFVVFIANGLFVQALKSSWATLRGKDDESTWSWQNFLVATMTAPLTGFPGYQGLAESGSLLSGPARAKGAWKRLIRGESFEDMDTLMRDADSMLTSLALASDSIATIASYFHGVKDIYNLLDTLLADE